MKTTRYVLINGINTGVYGLRVMHMTPIQIPQKRITQINIPGRSGQLSQWDGAYEEIVKTVTFFYKGPNPVDIARLLLEGSAITFSNEPDRVYDYRIDDGAELINTIASWHQFDVAFTCNPVKRELSPTKIVPEGDSASLINHGNYVAYPTIKIYGQGEVTLHAGTFTIQLKDIAPSITIDGAIMECYQGDILTNNKMTGDFPHIKPGETMRITWSGNISKLEIWPNWRWV